MVAWFPGGAKKAYLSQGLEWEGRLPYATQGLTANLKADVYNLLFPKRYRNLFFFGLLRFRTPVHTRILLFFFFPFFFFFFGRPR